MKNIKYPALLFFCAVLYVGCGSDDTESPDLSNEYPRIFGTWPGVNDNGEPGAFNVRKDSLLTITLQFTPANLCVGKWFIDDIEVYEGKEFTYRFGSTGRKTIRLEVSTPNFATSRDAFVDVAD